MNNETAFIQSILADPDDDAHRLVFADWLEDNGQPERAAFIRAQVRLATMAEDDPDRSALLRDEAAYLPHAQGELIAQERPAWLAKLPDWAAKGLTYERGLPARLRLTARRFAEEAAAIMAVVPVQHVELTAVKAGAGALAACPELSRLRSLTVRSDAVGTVGARALADSPHLAGLHTLVLHGAQITADGVVALAASPHLAGLRDLDLGHNPLQERGNQALANSPHLANLEWLSLQRSHVGPRSVAALARSPHLGKLRELNLQCARLVRVAEALGSSETLASLARLDLTGCEWGPDTAAPLLAPTGLPNLTQLCIGGWPWPARLWEVEPPARLRGRVAIQVQLDEGTEVLAHSPLLAACHTLEVSAYDGLACRAVAAAPAARGLVKLGVEFSHLTTRDVRALAGSPHFAALRDLSLAHNQLNQAGIEALLAAPFVRQLRRLDLTCTHLDMKALLLLAQTNVLAGLRELVLVEQAMRFGRPTIAYDVRDALRRRYGTRVRFQ
jgi:uncharacterized protein (TIGR02996 family)